MTWFSQALTLLFVAFKLLGIIDWNWWWVVAPILAEVCAMGSVSAFAWAVDWLWERGSEKREQEDKAKWEASRAARAAEVFESLEEQRAKRGPPA